MMEGASKADLPSEGVDESPSFICDEVDSVREVEPVFLKSAGEIMSDEGIVDPAIGRDGELSDDAEVCDDTEITLEGEGEGEIYQPYYDDGIALDEYAPILTFFGEASDGEEGEIDVYADHELVDPMPGSDRPEIDDVAKENQPDVVEVPEETTREESESPEMIVPVEDGEPVKGGGETEYVDLGSGPIIFTLTPQPAGEESGGEEGEVSERPEPDDGEADDGDVGEETEGKVTDVPAPEDEDPIIYTLGGSEGETPAGEDGAEGDDESDAEVTSKPISSQTNSRPNAPGRRPRIARQQTRLRHNAALVAQWNRENERELRRHERSEARREALQSSGSELKSIDQAFEALSDVSLKTLVRGRLRNVRA
jgi:hypothetical protein